jgi:hypothetical protein
MVQSALVDAIGHSDAIDDRKLLVSGNPIFCFVFRLYILVSC